MNVKFNKFFNKKYEDGMLEIKSKGRNKKSLRAFTM